MKKKSLLRSAILSLLTLNVVSCEKRIYTAISPIVEIPQISVTGPSLNALTSPNDYNLIWSDEFNYTGLPDPATWTYEVGFVRGNELQYYTQARPQNAYVQNGNLEITAIKEQYPNAAYLRGSTDWRTKDSFASYTSASITTNGRASWKYGRMEIRAKMPQGNGMWPAIWMMGINHSTVGWPKCGEVDILEYFGHNASKVTSNFHYANAQGNAVASNGGAVSLYYPYSDFSVYQLDWDEDSMTITVDGQHVTTFPLSNADFNGDNAFRKPFFWLLNYALGSYAGTPTGTVDDTKLPGKYLVDYVRIYKRNLALNGGLENASMNPWTISGNTASLTTDASDIRKGSKAIKISGTTASSIEQVVTGLNPNTTYIFGGYGKVDAAGHKGQIGAKSFNSTGTAISTTITSTSYTQGSVTFTTGPTNTSAILYYYRPLSGTAYGDDFYLNMVN